MFYSMEEAQAKLGRSATQIRQLIQDGTLREFRDGAKIMFKVDEVNALELQLGAPSPAASEDIPLSPKEASDSFSMSLSDSDLQQKSDSGQSGGQISPSPKDASGQSDLDLGGDIDQFDLAPAETGSSIGLAPGDSADRVSLDDTAQAQSKEDTVVTTHGLNVFEDSDEMGSSSVDPLAQTQIAPDIADQVALDGSGSGLLDLSREADDTSLGAELLEEIYSGTEEAAQEAAQPPSQLELPGELDIAASAAAAEGIAVTAGARAIQIYDPTSDSFGFMMILPFIGLIYLACVSAVGMAGISPAWMAGVSKYIWYITAGLTALALLIVVIGHVMAGASERPDKPKIKKVAVTKPKKEKKARK